MVTLQEQFEKTYPDKSVRKISSYLDWKGMNFTNYDLDLREYINIADMCLDNSRIDSVDFLNTIPNPEKLERLVIPDNNIQPTDIEIFSRFISLKTLSIGSKRGNLEKGQRNKFYGSFKSWKNLTKLETICIEATDVNEGLEYLPESLAKSTKEKGYVSFNCRPHNTDAKCSAIQDQLRPFNYDLEAWQLANPAKMAPIWKEKCQSKETLIQSLQTKIIQTKTELETVKTQEADKTKKISRLEQKLQLLQETHDKLKAELEKAQQQHNQIKTNFQSQLRDLATILFPNNSNFDNISFSDLKIQAEKIKKENGEWQEKIKTLNKEIDNLKHDKLKLEQQLTEINKKNLEKELEQAKNTLQSKLDKKDYEDLNDLLEAQAEFTISNSSYAQKQIEKYKQKLLKTEKTSEEELKNICEIQDKLTKLEKYSEAKIEFSPYQK